ncbi:LysR family transcriptional regulator [Microvirga sp. W0021]|uniref:LysR family transcriptional regulator n=1 Tax=Hohaiivirga grylli TaxID=3133970 RepID=A0ABV0BJ49_9HYPH
MKSENLTNLVAFSSIATHLNFRRAAIELQISPSALSHRIRNLEEHLDIRLLNRTTRSVSLTEAGETLLKKLQPALLDINNALEATNAFKNTPSGHIRISAPQSAIQLVLAPLIRDFRRQFPSITLELVSDAELVDIVQKGFDAGIRFSERLEQDMIAVPIDMGQRFTVVGSPDYLEKNGIPQTPHDLLKHDCIRMRFPSGKIYQWEFSKDGRDIQIAVKGSITLSHNHPAMLKLADDGIGLAYTFEDYAKPYLEQGSLIRVLEDWTTQSSSFYLYYPSRNRISAALRAFIDTVKVKR